MSISASRSFRPEEFFSFAGSIVRDSSANEAALRSAISRAYYAVYLVARDSLFGIDGVRLTNAIRKQINKKFRQTGRHTKDPGVHERVIFAITDKPTNMTLAQQIDQLREARINADYKMNYKVLAIVGKQSWREYAEETMQLAALVLPSARRLPAY